MPTDYASWVAHMVNPTVVTAAPAPGGRGQIDEVNIRDFGAVCDGVTDDTVAVQAAIDNVRTGGVVRVPPGTTVINQVTADKRFTFAGSGKYATVIKPVAGATGPLFNMNGTSFRPGFSMRGLTFDMTNVPTIAAVYLHNIRNGSIRDVRVDHGTVGIQLDRSQAMMIENCEVYDFSDAGFRLSDAASSANRFIGCLTDTIAVSGTVAFDVTAGIDAWFISCHALRAPGSPTTLNYGWRFDYVNTNATVALVRCSADGVTDGTSDSANVAGILLRNVDNCHIADCFISAAPVADGTANPCIKLDNSDSAKIYNSWLSGHGILFTGGASNQAKILNNQFSSPDTAGAMFNIATAPTNLDVRGNTLGSTSFGFPITNDVPTFYGALVRGAQVAAGLNLNRPASITFETVDLRQVANNALSLTSGTEYLFAIWLPRGLKVSTLRWMSGATPLANGASPHYWTTLRDSSKVLLGQSTDDTAPAIAANTLQSKSLASPFVTTYEGLHYIGIMVNSGGGTQPSASCDLGLSAVQNLSAVRCATADTGLTTTPPPTSGATANIGQLVYAGVA